MKRIAIVFGCVGAMLATAVSAQAAKRPEPPLAIARQGYFYVGGQKVKKADREVIADAMFVEYQIPAKRAHRWPIVMIHGGSTSGATFLGTPDDRPGWAEYFLRRGYAVYVVDQPTRGKSGYDPDIDGPLERAAPGSTERTFTAPEKFNTYPQAKLHTQWPGTGLPGDPIYERMTASQLATINGGLRMDTINRDAIAALLDRIGPAILLTHSRSGPFGWLAADARPGKVKAIVAMEPNGPVFKNADPSAGAQPPSNAERAWGIAYEKLTFTPAVTDPARDLAPVSEPPEGPGLFGCWKMGRPHTLPRLAGVPIVIMSAEASYHAQYDHCTARFLTQAGVANTFIRLADRGIHGNGHLMMLEKNNMQIAALIYDWLGKNVH